MTQLEECKYTIKCELDKDFVMSKKSEVISTFRNKNVKGFRPGKAPDDVIRLTFAKEIDEQLKGKLAYEAFMISMLEKKLQPVSEPSFNSIDLGRDKFVCEFTVFTMPDFELQKYKGFDITKAHGLKTVESLSAELMESLRKQTGETVPFTSDDFVQDGDSVIVNYEGFIDNQPIENLKADGDLMTVGKAGFFDENLLGMKIGENREFFVNVPEGSGSEFSGKSIKFKADLVMGSKTNPAPLDDALAQKLGLASLNDLIDQANMTASLRVKEIEDQYYYDQVGKMLITDNPISIPSWIIGEQLKSHLHQNNIDMSKLTDAQKSEYSELVEKNIKLSLILSKIKENEPDAQLTDEEVVKLVRGKIEQVSSKPDEVLQSLSKDNKIAILAARVRDEYVLQFVKNNSNILE